MKQYFYLLAAIAVMFSAIACGVGKDAPVIERIVFDDPKTGHEVWQITAHDSVSNMPYFEMQAFTHDDRFVIFRSWREGGPRIFRAAMDDGAITKISDRQVDYAYTIAPNGREVWFMENGVLYAVDVETLGERVVIDVNDVADGRETRFSASFTDDGNYTLFSCGVRGGAMEIHRVYLPENTIQKVFASETGYSHPQINPTDPDLISVVPYPDTQNDMSLPLEDRARTWIIDVRQHEARPFLMMPVGYRATHETWSADGQRFFFFRKVVPGAVPVSVCSIDRSGEDFRVHYTDPTVKLGHGIGSYDGKWFIADSQDSFQNPLQLIDLQTGISKILCWPNSTQAPGQGNPQEDHVHPSFSRSGKFVAFTSDAGTGTPQAFVMPIEQFLISKPRNAE